MKKKIHPPSISHDKLIVAHLRDDPEFAVEYLKAALEEATDEDGRYARGLQLTVEPAHERT